MNLRVSSPCPKSWEELPGNQRVRFCDECKLNVYNLADLAPKEVETLVRRSSGRLCGRLYLRGDRTATLRDCPKDQERRTLRRVVAVVAVLALAVFAGIFRGMEGPDRSRLPSWVRVVVDLVDPPTDPGSDSVVGLIRLPQAPARPAIPSPPPPPDL
jgi:hypothetical protein